MLITIVSIQNNIAPMKKQELTRGQLLFIILVEAEGQHRHPLENVRGEGLPQAF